MHSHILRVFLLFWVMRFTLAQVCDDPSIAKVLYSDITSNNPIYSPWIQGDAQKTATHTVLTDSLPGSYGGIFFNSTTEFQGTGGFSIRFAVRATSVPGAGDSWELVIASADNREVLPPPYGLGLPTTGRSGWTRSNALVVRFDSPGNPSPSSTLNAVRVYLDGQSQCNSTIPSPFSFEDGAQHTVWVDYVAFKAQLEIQVGTVLNGRRNVAFATSCGVDIWGTLRISEPYHVGFTAYNLPGNVGVEHSLVESISVADAYRPFDVDECASYAKCRQKSSDSMCIVPLSQNQCQLRPCSRSHVWDVTGTICCAFVEKTSLSVAISETPPFAPGQIVSCSQERKTISFIADASKCT